MTIDKTYIGIVTGLVLPVLTAIAFYKFGYSGSLGMWDFFCQLFEIRGVTMLIAVSCLPNLALFTFLAYIDKLKVVRGIFLSTLLFAMLIVILKFAF